MTFRSPGLAVVFGAAVSLAAALVVAPEPAGAFDCLSPDPAQWPAPSKPYFMIIVDTSGSMTTAVAGTNSCGFPNDRLGHARCAVQNTINAYSGEVNFGLSTYAWRLSGCSSATCFTGCAAQYPAANGANNFCGPVAAEPSLTATNIHYGANIVVPMLQDHYWSLPPDTSNVGALLGYVDNNCTGSVELGASSNTPIGGSLFNMNQYFSGTFADPFTGTVLASPIGTLAQGERSCRPLNVILITDGDETCDGGVNPTPIAGGCRAGQAAYLGTAASGERLASYEADRMFTNGITLGGQNFKVKTHVIGFAGATVASLDHIAACGGTTASYSTANEAALSTALSTIIASAVAPEGCDNTDNNCNGCIDEGYAHYCNVSQTCCSLARATCLSQYTASITPANPTGDLTKLPCTAANLATDPANWLCYNPGDICDGVDNNCAGIPGPPPVSIDENANKCGTPLHCPTPEICNGLDDNCNGSIDEGGVCGTCVASPEVCDGCDNDCDGIADNGINPIACGLPSPANCAGTKTCSPPKAVPIGGCAAGGGGFSACNNNPQPEICDGIDNNCNGIIDDGIAPVVCVPGGTNPALVYGGNSQCKKGTQACMGTCQGFVGPSAEICDGIDNDCNGVVDDMVFGAGGQCGTNTPPCSPGVVACVAGVLTCQGGVQPTTEICDGLDNNCNGQTDEAPLLDAPLPGQTGCWNLPGNCCSHGNFHWCPPAGGTCNNLGTLTNPCNTGSLQCSGAAGWTCTQDVKPSPEVCDGLDNNCNNAVDEGPFPQTGQVCGTNTGECQTGLIACSAGVLTCVGEISPVPELCDGLDNDCNGAIDNGIPTGGPCTPQYDTVAYPGPRTAAPCQPGVLQCNGAGGTVCVGGVGPTPEVCDGIDNDCDGTTDEIGAAPDGIDGSADPFAPPPPPPTPHIGDICGTTLGTCTQGNYACVNGTFSCLGGTTGTVESCDCKDNDCNGTVDNNNPGNNPPLCSTGKSCIHSATQGCQCALPCSGGEFPCPSGQVCETITMAEGAQKTGSFCVVSTCPDCTLQTVKDASNKILCAPAGTPSTDCSDIPVCECKGQNGCQSPCFGVTCTSPQVCTNFGPNAGKCVQDTCFNLGCQACNEVCDNTGACIQNPCTATTCQPGEVCKPSDDFLSHTCVATCAGIMCSSGKACKDGQCVATCDPPCAAGKVCDDTQATPTCVDSQCAAPTCPSGACCDALTGACGACPCEGVICPMGQTCQNDQCVGDMGTGGAGSTTSTVSTGASTGSGQGGEGTGGGSHGPNGVFGLATGGGGCTCDVSSKTTDQRGLGLAAVAIGAVVSRLRRRKEKSRRVASGEVSR